MGHKKEEVIAYDTDGPYVFSSLTLCASAYGMSRKKLISLIKSGSTWDGDARTTFDVPCYSTLDLGDGPEGSTVPPDTHPMEIMGE